MRSVRSLLFWLLVLSAGPLAAQTDSLQTLPLVAADLSSLPTVVTRSPLSPRRAALLAATMPGLGQIYNRQYWKAPIVLAGFGVAGYFIVDNTSKYNRYLTAYRLRTDGNPNTVDEYDQLANPEIRGLSDNNLLTTLNYWRRNRDFAIIATVLGYFVQMTDAYVAAHLSDFDINDDLSLRARPTLLGAGPHVTPGLSVRLLVR